MLRRLRAAELSTAILSNGSPEMLTAAVENAGLVGLFDPVLSIELVGVYKPHAKVYRSPATGSASTRALSSSYPPTPGTSTPPQPSG